MGGARRVNDTRASQAGHERVTDRLQVSPRGPRAFPAAEGAGSSAKRRKAQERPVVIAAIGIKRLGIVFAAVAAVGFGTLLVLPFLIPPQTVREAVATEI